MLDELRDVLTPIAKRRDGDRKNVQPVVQVAAKPALTDFFGEDLGLPGRSVADRGWMDRLINSLARLS